MFKLDKIFQKVDGDFVEFSLEDWMKNSNLLVQSYQAVYSVDSDVKPGDSLDLPAGMYDPTKDVMIINQEGFILVQDYQYNEEKDKITFKINIKKGTNIYIIILKLHGKLTGPDKKNYSD